MDELIKFYMNMILQELVVEMLHDLYLLNAGEKDVYEFTGFMTGSNDRQVTFDKNFEINLIKLSQGIYNNFDHKFKIDEIQFKKIVKKAIVNLVTTQVLDLNSESDVLCLIRVEIENLIGKLEVEHVHIIPARTLKFETKVGITIGPVSIYPLDEWIDSAKFPDQMIKNYGSEASNLNWKEDLKKALNDNQHNVHGVASEIYNTVKDSNSIIKVSLSGFEFEFSKKLSSLVAKSSLDMISLFLGWENAFFKQIIHGERIGPTRTFNLCESNGYLGLPGSTLEKQVHPMPLNEENVKEFLIKFEEFKEKFEYVLDGFVNRKTCKHPLLAHRWIYALRWYAEGIREPNDTIAVAKLACCLDALSDGGKLGGIKNLLTNMLGLKSDEVIFNDHIQNVDLDKFVRRIYNHGRSRILHGTIEDMLESYELDKKRLIVCARLVLLESLERLYRYDGVDNGKAFQSMM